MKLFKDVFLGSGLDGFWVLTFGVSDVNMLYCEPLCAMESNNGNKAVDFCG